MGTTLLSLISLFASCFILMMGNGLVNVLLPVTMELDGINTDTIGLVLSLYYIGMFLGAVYSKNLIRRVGHVRVFSGVVALGAVSILVCSFDSDPILWGAMRALLGFCNACAYTAMESWLSASSTKESRGKVLAAYNAVVLSGLFAGQFILNLAAPGESTLFVVGGVLLCLAIMPIALSRNSAPVIDDVAPMSILSLIKKSPLGVVCCVAGGLIYAALFNMLPVFAKYNNIVDFELTLYMGAAILGAFILQFPIGYLSDRFDRRTVIFVLLIVSSGIGILATLAASLQLQWPLFIATGLTTGIIACLYPLSISEAFDRLKQNEMVAAMGSMILGFSLGGVLGPYSSSIVMNIFGNNSLFYFLAVVQGMLACFVLYRMNVREALPVDKQESFVMQGATIPAMVDLDPRTEYVPVVKELSPEAQSAVEIAQTDQGAAVKMVRAMAVSRPEVAVEMASALATVADIDVLRLYEVMRQALPYRIMGITREIIGTKPELAYELVKKLAESHPDQVVSVAAEIGFAYPEIRVDMAKVAVESAPESALEVAEYYARVLAEEREALRPADEAEDTSEQDVIDIANELWEVSPEQAIDVAVTMAEAVPETAVTLATELAENIIDEETDTEQYLQNTEEQEPAQQSAINAQPQSQGSGDDELKTGESDEADAALNLVQRLSEVVPESAVDVAVAVVEAIPESAAVVASDVVSTVLESVTEDVQLEEQSDELATDLEDVYQEAIETDAAIDIVQRLSEAAPDNAIDVAAAVVEAVPESAGVIASEVVSNLSEEVTQQGNKAPSDLAQAHQAAINTDMAIDLVQRLSEVAPDNTSEVAAAVVDVVPESASLLVDNISAGKESEEGEWMSRLDEAPKSIDSISSDEVNR